MTVEHHSSENTTGSGGQRVTHDVPPVHGWGFPHTQQQVQLPK